MSPPAPEGANRAFLSAAVVVSSSFLLWNLVAVTVCVVPACYSCIGKRRNETRMLLCAQTKSGSPVFVFRIQEVLWNHLHQLGQVHAE